MVFVLKVVIVKQWIGLWMRQRFLAIRLWRRATLAWPPSPPKSRMTATGSLSSSLHGPTYVQPLADQLVGLAGVLGVRCAIRTRRVCNPK